MTLAPSTTVAAPDVVPAARTAPPVPTQRSPWSLRPAEARPVAAVRLPGRDFSDLAEGLNDAGFSVLDILAHQTGPAPLVLVLALPAEEDAAARLLAAGSRGPARVLVVDDREQVAGVRLRAHVDAVVESPFHPLQVAAAALRVSGAPEWRLARWSESVFDALPVR
jgi:hypothetical protein